MLTQERNHAHTRKPQDPQSVESYLRASEADLDAIAEAIGELKGAPPTAQWVRKVKERVSLNLEQTRDLCPAQQKAFDQNSDVQSVIFEMTTMLTQLSEYEQKHVALSSPTTPHVPSSLKPSSNKESFTRLKVRRPIGETIAAATALFLTPNAGQHTPHIAEPPPLQTSSPDLPSAPNSHTLASPFFEMNLWPEHMDGLRFDLPLSTHQSNTPQAPSPLHVEPLDSTPTNTSVEPAAEPHLLPSSLLNQSPGLQHENETPTGQEEAPVDLLSQASFPSTRAEAKAGARLESLEPHQSPREPFPDLTEPTDNTPLLETSTSLPTRTVTSPLTDLIHKSFKHEEQKRIVQRELTDLLATYKEQAASAQSLSSGLEQSSLSPIATTAPTHTEEAAQRIVQHDLTKLLSEDYRIRGIQPMSLPRQRIVARPLRDLIHTSPPSPQEEDVRVVSTSFDELLGVKNTQHALRK